MEDLFNVFQFVFITPFAENLIFPTLILGMAGFSLYFSSKKNNQRFNEYKNNIDGLIFDDYKKGKALASVPGILMSIGIIGTFFLIYDSLHQLDVNTKDAMMDTIRLHIAPAFSISALGIVSSIVYLALEQILILEV